MPRKNLLFVSVTLICFYFTLFSIINKSTFTDTAFFGGDTWEYQSMGVNFAKGHGLQMWGGIEEFKTYKFDRADTSLITSFYLAPGSKFYRTPGYPMFLGIIYKIFGVSPLIVKHIQLLLLCIIAGFLPWIGFYFWKNKGFISGLIASAVYISSYYETSETILTESLTAFGLFLIIISYIYFESRKNTLSAVLLGFFLALGLLIKGSLIFMPFLILLYLLKLYRNSKDKSLLKNIFFIFSFLLLTLLPWSLYASAKSNSFVILSTQGKAALLDCNNEYCTDGDWHPEWSEPGKNSFYSRDNMENASAALRVINFYSHNIKMFPKIMLRKITRGFLSFVFLWITLLLFLMQSGLSILKKYIKKISLYRLCVVLSLIWIAIVLFYNFYIPFLHLDCYKVILILIIPALVFFGKNSLKAPAIFVISFINFIFIVLMTLGEARYIGVMSFVFVIFSIRYCIEFYTNTIAAAFPKAALFWVQK